MEVHEIQTLIEMFERSTLSELTLERGGERLILKRDPVQGGIKASTASVKPTLSSPTPAPVSAAVTPPPQTPSPLAGPVTAENTPDKLDGYVIKSPIVGTFYRRPGPNEEPYVEMGDRVEKGDTVCIVEAMKVMNEIKSDQSGSVDKILVEDGKPVEYGQALMVLRIA